MDVAMFSTIQDYMYFMSMLALKLIALFGWHQTVVIVKY